MPLTVARSRRSPRIRTFALLLCHVAPWLHALRADPVVAQGRPDGDSVAAAAVRPGDPPSLRRRAHWGAAITAPADSLGAVVRSVVAGSPAARAGLRAGDRIVRLNGVLVTSQYAYWPAVRAVRGGDSVRLEVARPDQPTATLRFVVDSLPHERIAGADVAYGSVVSDRGHRLRTILTRPAGSGARRVPGVLFVQWLSCASVESPLPTTDGFQRMLLAVAARAGAALLRVEKPGVGDSGGPDCTRGTLDDEVAGYRAALRALRATPGVDTTRLFVMGGSLGGGLAPILAAESPAGVRGVISVGGFAKTWYEHMLEIERRRLALTGRTPGEVNDAMRGFAVFYTEYLLGRRTPAEVLAAHPELRPLWYDEPTHQYGRPAAYYHQAQALNVEGAWAALAERGVPALVVWGEYDWIMSRDDQELAVGIVNRRRPGLATLAVLPRTGHGLTVFDSLAESFADEREVYDGQPDRMIVSWLREKSR
jgi:pimeloyl-ACP methyl ester carboxylesterase